MGGSGQLPQSEELALARQRIGMALVELNENDFTVKFSRDGVMLDLGAIGKGYAVERAAELLRETGITSALLNGGTSTIHALGPSPRSRAGNIGRSPWNIPPQSPQTSLPLLSPQVLACAPATPTLPYWPAMHLARRGHVRLPPVWGRSFFKPTARPLAMFLIPAPANPSVGPTWRPSCCPPPRRPMPSPPPCWPWGKPCRDPTRPACAPDCAHLSCSRRGNEAD